MYSCRFLEDGTVQYEDGIFYVSNETIRKMANSMLGKPICIGHQKITPENYEEMRQNGIICGNVTKVWFNAEDGWWWADFLADTKKARQRIEINNDKVSCAYTVHNTKEGGLWHNQPYDAEITGGEFTHLALVENPRYEEATITQRLPDMMLVNGKVAYHYNKQEETDMNIKELVNSIFNKKPDGTKENITPVVVLNGKEFPLATVLEAIQEKFNAEGEMKGVVYKGSDDDIVDVNGHSYSIADLKNAMKEKLQRSNEKCTCTPDDEGMHKENCAMYKKNSSDEAKEKEDKEAKDKENARIINKAKENGKTIAEVIAEEAAEKLNGKETDEVKELRLENARLKKEKDAKDLFNSLNDLSNYNGTGEAETPAAGPMSRLERANKKAEQISKQRQFAKA